MNKRMAFFVGGILLLSGAAFCGVKVFQGTYAPKMVLSENMESPADSPTPAPLESQIPELETEDVEPTSTPEPTPEPTAVPYVSPIDFAELQEINPDIYAWLEIDNTNISYPIVQCPTNNAFYLNHNSDGNYSANGAIFSEATYNGADMSDPVTILYGHHMNSGDMFGNLQKYYSDGTFFQDNPTITVYTPEEELTYGVFAAVPYSSQHILYYNDFTDSAVFATFFDSIFNVRELGANFNEDYAPQEGDSVLILSTCLIGNNTRRFLVMATLLA